MIPKDKNKHFSAIGVAILIGLILNVSGLISKIALKSNSIELENTILKIPSK